MLYIMYDVSLEELQKGELASEDEEGGEAEASADEELQPAASEALAAPTGALDAETVQRLFAEIESLKKLLQDKA